MNLQARVAAARDLHYPPIAALLADVLRNQQAGGLLSEMCTAHLATGGKRLRAVLAVLAVEALGEDPVRAYPLAAACEMLHNATLVHDDAQDGDVERRGQPTAWVRYGLAQAINLGDAMVAYSLLCLDRLDAPDGLRWALAREMLQGAARVMDGQVRELELKQARHPSLAAYVAMVERKTSALFALPLVGAARYCGAEPALLEVLAEAAWHLGVIFQIQDDLLDLWGDKGRGRRGNDLREGKISVLVVHALDRADRGEAARLREVLQRPRGDTSDADVTWAIELFERLGSRASALDEIHRRERAVAALPGLETRAALAELITGLPRVFTAPIAHLS